MIKNLEIKNFKSIKHLQMPCKKLNVFIGEPNSGKSNIIEALSLQSQNIFGTELSKSFFRYKTIGDLFYDFNINTPIEIATDDKKTVLSYAIDENNSPQNIFNYFLDDTFKEPYRIQHDGKIQNGSVSRGKTDVHYYEFKRLSHFVHGYQPHLSVPHGENLPSLLLSNPDYKEWVIEFLQSKGLTLTLKPNENDIAASKFVGGAIYSYNYFSISETLQRVIFYTMAIKTNLSEILLFDEPETNTFPFYTKFLGERIALDETNQFFITTHNPYLLLSLIEKSKFEDLNVCLVQMKDYETQVAVLNKEQVSKVLVFDSDVFFNFNDIIT